MPVSIFFLPYSRNNGSRLNPNGNDVASMIKQTAGSVTVAVPDDTQKVRSLRASFSNLNVGDTRYFGMEGSNNKIIWRSGKVKIDNSSLTYILVPEQVQLSATEVRAMAPSTPIVQGKATIDKIKMSLKSGKVEVSGSGTYDAFINVGYNFTYSFKLEPYTSYLNVSRVIDVVTVDKINVTGSNRFLGFIVSLIADFLEEDLTKDLENRLQEEIDKAVAAQIADLVKDNLGDASSAGITVTVQNVTINSSGVTVDVIAGIPGSAIDCPSSLTERKSNNAKVIGARSAESMKTMRQMRDDILMSSQRGKDYHELFTQHRDEIFGILIEHPEIVSDSDIAIKRMMTDLHDGDGKISEKTASSVKKLMNEVQPHASRKLKKAIDELLNDVDSFVDNEPKKVLKKKKK